jgi:hypothetical protein
VETLANGSGADDEPVALSYDGGGSSGGCCVDILDACAQAIGRLIPPQWMLSLEGVIGMNNLDVSSCLGADQTARGGHGDWLLFHASINGVKIFILNTR